MTVTAALTLAVAALLVGFAERSAQAAAATLAPDAIVGESWTVASLTSAAIGTPRRHLSEDT